MFLKRVQFPRKTSFSSQLGTTSASAIVLELTIPAENCSFFDPMDPISQMKRAAEQQSHFLTAEASALLFMGHCPSQWREIKYLPSCAKQSHT